MSASIPRRLVALLCAVVPLIPLTGLYFGESNCGCCTSVDSCFCELTAKVGAHCDLRLKGRCSMQPLRSPSGTLLFVSFDLRGWLQIRQEIELSLAPADRLPLLEVCATRSLARSPELPPPRSLVSA